MLVFQIFEDQKSPAQITFYCFGTYLNLQDYFRMNFKLSSGNTLNLLKALVFERMGKTDETLLPLCLNSKDACLVDDITLSAFQIVFQRIDCSDLPTSYYEYACGKIQNNLGLLMGFFNYSMHQYFYV